jgi:hypothetical protein
MLGLKGTVNLVFSHQGFAIKALFFEKSGKGAAFNFPRLA